MESSSSSSSSDDIGQVSNKRSRKQGEEEADNNVLNERENKHISSATVTATAPEDIALPNASELFKSSISRTQKLYASSFFTLDNDVSDKKVYSDIKFMSEFKNAWQLSTGGSGRYQTKTVTAFKEKPVLAIKQNGEDIKTLSSSSNEDSINSQSTQIIKRQKVELGNKDVKETARIEELEKPISRALAVRREPVEEIEIDEHPNWELYRVISGHLGAVKSIAVDPTNKWFATGSQDHMIKIWDTATGGLMLTLAHHIHGVLGLSISSRHPYLFSAGEDKQVLCWDLTKNAVARHYHGHLSGVYSCAVHPTLDLLVTGGRDSSVRVWDMRTSRQVHLLGGHTNTVWSVITQGVNPQIISGSADSQVRLWDIVAGKAMNVLTHHKKGVRSVAMHPREYTFASASSDNTKKWLLPSGTFMTNFDKIENEIVNSIAINSQGVMARGGNNGMLRFYDYKSGKLYQSEKTIVQPGSLESEAGIHALAFDMTGSRLITCEADKTIKMWREESGNSS